MDNQQEKPFKHINMCLDGFSFPIFFPKSKLCDEQRRNKNNIQKSENPLFIGKTAIDEQRQTNFNTNPDDEELGEIGN